METTCRCWISLFYYGKNLLCISFVREYFSSRLARGGYFFQRLNSSLHSDNIHQRKRSRRPPSLFRHNHRLGPGFHSVNVPFRRRLSNDSSPITAFTTRSPQSTAVHPFPGFTHIDSQFSSRAPLKLQGFLDWFVGCEDLSALPISYRCFLACSIPLPLLPLNRRCRSWTSRRRIPVGKWRRILVRNGPGVGCLSLLKLNQEEEERQGRKSLQVHSIARCHKDQ